MPCVAAQPRNLEAHKSSIMSLFVKCTKDDVTLNNYVTRSKCPEQNIASRLCVHAVHGKTFNRPKP